MKNLGLSIARTVVVGGTAVVACVRAQKERIEIQNKLFELESTLELVHEEVCAIKSAQTLDKLDRDCREAAGDV